MVLTFVSVGIFLWLPTLPEVYNVAGFLCMIINQPIHNKGPQGTALHSMSWNARSQKAMRMSDRVNIDKTECIQSKVLVTLEEG